MCYSSPFPAVADYNSAPGLKSASPAHLCAAKQAGLNQGLVRLGWIFLRANQKSVVRNWRRAGAVVVVPQIQATI